jgi:hypothetical protein
MPSPEDEAVVRKEEDFAAIDPTSFNYISEKLVVSHRI